MKLPTVVLVSLVLFLVAWVFVGVAAAAEFQYNILDVTGTAPSQLPTVRFSVTNPNTGAAYDIKTHPAFTQPAGVSRLFVQIGWNTRDYTNTNSGTPGGAALPIAINVLTPATTANGDGTFTVVSATRIPLTATGTGAVALEGHPAGQDPVTGAWTVRVPVKSVVKFVRITDATVVPRATIVDIAKCDRCHGQLTVHGNNRTDEPQVCVICHNPNQTDIAFRLLGDPAPQFGTEQAIDFKRMIHSIHGGKMRRNPFIVIGFNHSVNDFSGVRFPADLDQCQRCHVETIDASGRLRGTFELPISTRLGTTISTGTVLTATQATKVIDTDPSNDLKITPTAATCSGCHDDRETIDHMKWRGRAQFGVTQAAIDSANAAGLGERCPACHGRGKEEDVRKAHMD